MSENIVANLRKYFMRCGLQFFEEPFVVVQGKGATLTDANGDTYLDFSAGHAAAIYGHCHPRIVAAIKDQAESLIHCPSDLQSKPAAELAARLAKSNSLGLTRSFFLNSGSEAVECAMFLARKHTKKNGFIALDGAFHGRTYGARSLTAWYKYKRQLGPYMASIIHMPSYYCYRCRFCTFPDCNLSCANVLEDVLKYETSDDIAAFVAEPFQGTAGNIPAPEGYFRRVKEILEEHDILFIDDEIICGLGRTGKLYGIEHYGVKPDIVTLAKTLAGGFPISATMAAEEVASSFESGDYFSTTGGNPVACAAALAGLDIVYEEKLVERAHKVGEKMTVALNKMYADFQLFGDVRGKGLLIGVELVKNRATKETATAEARKIKEKAKSRGLILALGGWLGHCLRINPPLIITDEEAHKGLEIIQEIMQGQLD